MKVFDLETWKTQSSAKIGACWFRRPVAGHHEQRANQTLTLTSTPRLYHERGRAVPLEVAGEQAVPGR
jgi:hypothetical protein